jgi:hypothetical protein
MSDNIFWGLLMLVWGVIIWGLWPLIFRSPKANDGDELVKCLKDVNEYTKKKLK